jgi:hypothetical protein
MKKWVWILIGVILLVGAIYFFWDYFNPSYKEIELNCINSGGAVFANSCGCPSGKSFYNNCEVGACSCPSLVQHLVKTCHCEEGKCFNGTRCISREEFNGETYQDYSP